MRIKKAGKERVDSTPLTIRMHIECVARLIEGFPMGVIDAWVYGLPVITTLVGGTSDIAIDGKNILLFTPGDIDALATQMEKMISNENLSTRGNVTYAPIYMLMFIVKQKDEGPKIYKLDLGGLV